jgi:transcriptional regulator with GAF, ATPase, and Fis domain
MMITGKTLFAFVDAQDPFTPSVVAGEEQTGPILSLMAARPFNFLILFHTRRTSPNALDTLREVGQRHPECEVVLEELPDIAPEDPASLIRHLSRRVAKAVRASKDSENHVCMSSGTSEDRAALFFLVAAGRLFGSPGVKEARLDNLDMAGQRRVSTPADYRQLSYADLQFELPIPAEQSLELENALKEEGICAGSKAMKSAAAMVEKIAPSKVPALILGEPGTGKELFARLVHRLSDRRHRSFIAVNCAAINETLAESEMFGHVKGAFTGAEANRTGKFELADKGTLFLDEVGDLSPGAQAKLLRALQEGEIQPLGTEQTRKVDVRVVAATNKNLKKMIEDKTFRDDLYYRLAGIELHLPPLRERIDDIPELADALLRKATQELKRAKSLSKESLRRLMQRSWPGNVRELDLALKRSALVASGDVLEPEDLWLTVELPGKAFLELLPVPEPGFDLKRFLEMVRAYLIHKALSMCKGSQTQAAELLGISKQAVSGFLAKPDDQAA